MLTRATPSVRLKEYNVSGIIKMIDIKRRELLLGFMVAGAGFVVTPGFTNTENRKKLKILVEIAEFRQ